MRTDRIKWTPIAPKLGPLTHAVRAVKPSETATLMSLKRAVAVRTLSISGEVASSAAMAIRGIVSGNNIDIRRRKMLIGVLLFVEVRIEDPNLGDLRDRQFVAGRGTAHGLGRRPVIDAEGALAIGRDVGMQPRNTVLRVVVDDLAAKTRAALVLRDAEAVRKLSLDQVTRHGHDLQ